MTSISSAHHITFISDASKSQTDLSSMTQIHNSNQPRLHNRSCSKDYRQQERHPINNCNYEGGHGLPDDVAGNSSGTDGPSRKRRRSRKGLDKKFECSQPGCGKSYSRAEHLYRHQLNHTPKQIYNCDFPDCDRTFVRLDLCNRHKDRHTAKGSQLNRKEFMHSNPHETSLTETGKTSLGRGSSSPEVTRLNTSQSKPPLNVISVPYESPQDRQQNLNSPYLKNSLSSFPGSTSLNGAENFTFKLSSSNESFASRGNDIASTSPRNLPQRSLEFGTSEVKQSQFVRPIVPVKLGPYGVISSLTGPPNYNNQPSTQEPFVTPQNLVPFSLPPPYFSPTAPSPVTNIDRGQPYSASLIGTDFPDENLPHISDELMTLDQMASSNSSMPVFGSEGCNRTPFVIPEDFVAYLFNNPTPDQMGRLAYTNYQNTQQQHYNQLSFNGLGNFLSHHQLPQRRMAVTSLLDTSLPETVISEEKSLAIVNLIKTRFNQKNYAPDSIQKEAFLEGDRNQEKHLLSRNMMQKCIGSYWYHFSKQVPILHKPTFAPDNTPNILLIAMMTIGASCLHMNHDVDLSQPAGELSNFLALHLRWEIFSDDSFRPPAKLWVFQALLLLELYEKMYSTRALHERAHIHHATTITLMRRGSSLIGRSAMDSTLNEDGHGASAGLKQSSTSEVNTPDEWWKHWVVNEATRRAAFVAFVIDSTHATMFGHSLVMAAHEMRLPLPCDEKVWSAPNSSEAERIEASLHASGVKPISFSEGLKRTLNAQEVQTNPFGRTILMAGLLSVCWHMNQRDLQLNSLGISQALGGRDKWRGSLARAFDLWNQDFERSLDKNVTTNSNDSREKKENSYVIQTKTVLHHLAHMAMHVDIVDCQIFARAKRLLGRTIGPQDLLSAQRRMRDMWAPTAKARDATWYALQFLCTVLLPEDVATSGTHMGYNDPLFEYSARDDPLLNRSWVLYFAALTVWSYGFALEGPSINIPEKYHERCQVQEMRAYLRRFGRLRSAEDLKGMKGFNGCAAMLMVLREVFKKTKWELLQEAANLLDNCIQLLGGLST